MIKGPDGFRQIAESVVRRAADLLCAPVWALDAKWHLVTQAQPHSSGEDDGCDVVGHGDSDERIRVPLQVGVHSGEIIVGDSASGEIIPPRLAAALVQSIISETIVLMQLPNRQEIKNKFIHDLLRGNFREEADMQREGQILGMDLTLPRAVILIDAGDYILDVDAGEEIEASGARIPRRAQLVIASIVSFFNLPNDTICAYIGDGEIAILKASSTNDLVAWADREEEHATLSPSWANLTALKRAANALLLRLRHDTQAAITIGIGRYHPEIRGLARSYQDARAALMLGQFFHGRNQVHCLDGLGIAAFVGVSDERTKIDLALHLLSPLDQEPELLETLDAFFANDCSHSATASRLSIHRNTLSYRLDKISSLTGLDPRNFDHAVQIRLALVLRALCARTPVMLPSIEAWPA